MSKQIKDYLHLYLDCDVFEEGGNIGTLKGMLEQDGKLRVLIDASSGMDYWTNVSNVKPILRPLSDMNSEEADYFAWLCMDSRHHLEEETRLTQEEIQTELVKNDNGNMLDDNVEIYIDLTARCFEGAVVIKKDGSITVYDSDNDKYDSVDDVAFKIHFLLSKHFDLFSLIEEGLALDATTIKNETT